ncbi:hypothetical protein ON010_g10727 [Phytophthora cinnamomi]|nr:hypothetical protein ON010_g10727 [Phytophthora cinnamomi]
MMPFAQPQPVTISETVAVRFNTTLNIDGECYLYRAVVAAGEITGGLKSTGEDSGYTDPQRDRKCTAVKLGTATSTSLCSPGTSRRRSRGANQVSATTGHML